MALDFLVRELGRLETLGLLREEALPGSAGGLVDACSNDYLGLAGRGVSRETLSALAGVQGGAGASRLIHGTAPQHLALERDLAHWVRAPAALLFSSGYAANVGTLTALAGPGDLIVSDALNHASIIDGCRLSRAEIAVYPHCDVDAARRALSAHAGPGRRWLVTESYFSMDGDSPDLQGLAAACRDADAALLVDEAHALGVFGPKGAGLCAETGVRPDALIGTLGKAVGVQGAFVAGSTELRQWLWNRARSQVFSTAPSPVLAALASDRVRQAKNADAERRTLANLGQRLHEQLRARSVDVPSAAAGPIVPIVLGTNERALRVATAVRRAGFLAQAIRPPTVPTGSARLRVTLHATMSTEQVDQLATAIANACSSS